MDDVEGGRFTYGAGDLSLRRHFQCICWRYGLYEDCSRQRCTKTEGLGRVYVDDTIRTWFKSGDKLCTLLTHNRKVTDDMSFPYSLLPV